MMGFMGGARFCIYFSAAQRTVEFIFSSDHDLATFIGNITMDVAKIVVTMFLTEMSMAIITGIATVANLTLSISIGIVIIVSLGFIITRELIIIDEKYQLSEKLIKQIKEGMKAYQDINNWNLKHTNTWLY